MNRRQGLTLMEVLVAVMITGVGLLAILTLFPLGAMEMAQSVKDDRAGHLKHNAASTANIFAIRDDPGVRAAMLNPGAGLPNLMNAAAAPINPDMPSYPVVIDPIGFNYPQTVIARDWVGGLALGNGGQTPPRVSYRQMNPAFFPQILNPTINPPGTLKAHLYRWNVLLDDVYFPRNVEDYPGMSLGMPCPPPLPGAPPIPNGVVERTPRYSWAYIAQMPRIRTPNLVELTVVMYSGRVLDDPTLGEAAYRATWDPATFSVSLSWPQGAAAPDISPGTWIMDGTMLPVPRGSMHRVVGVNQTSGLTMDLELQTAPRGAGPGIAIVMENVVEVYVRGEN